MTIGFHYKKAVQALAFFAQKSGGRLNKMKAIKLIWLADRLHLRKYARTITGDIYFAMPYGPVASSTRDLLEHNDRLLSQVELEYTCLFLGKFEKYEYSHINSPDLSVFSKTDIECLCLIYDAFGNFDAFTLSELSHQFPEWRAYEALLEQGNCSRFEIDFALFFEKIPPQLSIEIFNESEDFLEISKSLYFV
ncbi:Panacea domain-containing protein [Hugenholtzia roseola]|uniref:Panacea domain-containing protein n=1 Tax=Hugenholtzia roseola TaxID=1002 RepID=UPI0004173A71|nr:Panacea domain-containing protein [Hugenholtzia roseola]